MTLAWGKGKLSRAGWHPLRLGGIEGTRHVMAESPVLGCGAPAAGKIHFLLISIIDVYKYMLYINYFLNRK